MHLFHSWDIWVTEEREQKSEFLTCASLTNPTMKNTVIGTQFFQFRECSKCGKRKGGRIK